MSGTAGLCLPTGCGILNRCMCCHVPSGLGIIPNLLFVPFCSSHCEQPRVAVCVHYVIVSGVSGQAVTV